MLIIRKLLIWLGLFTASAATAQSAPVPATTPAAPTAATTDADPALWVVKDADTTIYLFGTIHALKPGLSWFDDGVKTAFDSSDELVLEMVQPDAATMQKIVVARAIRPTGPTLPQRLPKRDQVRYANALSSLGLPYNAFDRTAPWFAATNLSLLPLLKSGYDASAGPETVLSAAATAAGKPVRGLETAEEQIGFLAGLPEPVQIDFLEATLKEMPQASDSMGKMVGAWSRGDPDALGALLNADLDDSPVLAKTLLFDRNARWATWIKDRLDKPGTVFVAVGAGHLAGPKSVIAQLKSLNINAERVNY